MSNAKHSQRKAGLVPSETESGSASGLHIIRRQKMARRDKKHIVEISEDFMRDPNIKKMLRLENGRSLAFIYIRLLLDAADSNGHIIVDEACDSVIEQISLDLDLDDSEVEPLVNYLQDAGMLEKRGDDDYFLTKARKYVAFEEPPLSDSAERVRRYRIRQGIKKDLPPYIEPIGPETDRNDYSCNCYPVLRRGGFRCAVCGGTKDISVYHIDGYPSRKKGGNTQNKLITLCGKCRNDAEGGKPIDDSVLKKIRYYG